MSVTKRSDGRWRARYRGSDGKERSKHFARADDATCRLTCNDAGGQVGLEPTTDGS